MTKIKGHTVGSDGIVYNPDTASFGYVSSMDSRVTNNSSDERGALVTDQGRAVPVHNVAALTVSTAGSGSAGSGPGAAGVVTGSGGGGNGPGAKAVATAGNRGAFRSQLTVALPYDSPSKLMPLVVAGRNMAHDPGWSNAGDVEERLGEGEFLSPSWFYSWGVSGADAWANASVNNGGPIKTQKVQEDLYNAPGVVGSGLTTIGQGFLDTRAAMKSPFGPDKPVAGFTSGGF